MKYRTETIIYKPADSITQYSNSEASEAAHLFYNPKTNEMMAIKYRRDLEMYEVRRSFCLAIMSMERILAERDREKWEFLGVL